MPTALPLNRLGSTPSAESIPMGGPLGTNITAVGAGLTSVIGPIDVAAWGVLRAQLKVTALGGTLAVGYSTTLGGPIDFPGAALPAVVAGVPYDSGALVPLAQFATFTYTQAGGGASGVFFFAVLASGWGGTGGGGGGVVVNVDLQGQVESLPAPSPSSIRGALTNLALLEEPDRALRTRARVLTDESSYNDDMYGGATGAALTGTALFTAGSAAVVGIGTLFTTEVRCGDYVILWADFMTTAPLRWGRVASVTDNTHLTLEAVYAGPGAAVAGAVSLARWVTFQDGVSGGEGNAASIERVSPGVGAAGQSGIFRAVGVPGGKQGLPLDIYWYGSVSARNGANQRCDVQVVSPAYSGGPWSAGIRWNGSDPDTTIRCRSSGGAGGSDLWDESVVMPGGALAVNYHLYRMRVALDRVDFWVDPQLNPVPVASHQWHVPYPYGSYVVSINAVNTGVPGGDVNLLTDEIIIVNDNDVRALIEQPDASKLNANVWVQNSTPSGGLVESQPAPNPAAVVGTVSTSLELEPDHALRTRSRDLTDEESFSDDFKELSTAVAGGLTLTPGSVVVAGANLDQKIKAGDYVQIDADDNPAVPAWTQVKLVASGGATAELVAAYTGAVGGVLAAAHRANWQFYDSSGVAGTFTVANSVISLNAGVGLGLIMYAKRSLGFGGRKASQPIVAEWYGNLNHGDANQTAWIRVQGQAPYTDRFVRITYDAADTTQVVCGTGTGGGATNRNLQTVKLPGGGVWTADHYYTLVFHHGRVEFFIDHQRVAVSYIHVPEPYLALDSMMGVENAAGVAPAPGGILAINWHDYGDYDDFLSTVEQTEASKLNATVLDATPFVTGVPRAPTNIADNNVHELTDVAGTGMDKGKHYLVQQIGGADLCYYVAAGAAPAVATVRRGPDLFNGIPWEITCRTQGERVWVVKAVDGTANADVKFCATDGGSGA